MNDVMMKTFDYPRTLIREFKYWVVLLRDFQSTLGSLVLVNKSGAKHLGELSSEEWTEFAEVSRFAENLLRETFGAEKFNYFALMMADPNVHFHLIPRYSGEVEFAGEVFRDRYWPKPAELDDVEVSQEMFARLLEKLKAGALN